MSYLLASLMLVLLAGCAPFSNPVTSPEPYTVSGVVVDDAGAPVKGASVTYEGDSEGSATTDSEGRFTLSLEGSVTLNVLTLQGSVDPNPVQVSGPTDVEFTVSSATTGASAADVRIHEVTACLAPSNTMLVEMTLSNEGDAGDIDLRAWYDIGGTLHPLPTERELTFDAGEVRTVATHFMADVTVTPDGARVAVLSRDESGTLQETDHAEPALLAQECPILTG